MRIPVASVGPNPLLPKNPATNLPARSFRGLSLCSSCHHPPRSRRERKIGSPSASVPLQSSVSDPTAHVPCLPPPEKWPVCFRAQEGDLSAHLALPHWWHWVHSSSSIGLPRAACSPTPDGVWAF